MKTKKQRLHYRGHTMWGDFHDQIAYEAGLHINQSVQRPATFRIHILVSQEVNG